MSSATLPPRNDSTPTPALRTVADSLPSKSTRDGQNRAPKLLVATDGSRSSLAALRLGARLAARDDELVEALVVEEPLPLANAGVCIDGETLKQEPMPTTTDLGRIRQQLCYGLRTRRWNLHVEFGRAAPTIAVAGRAYGARLIVMGLSRHHPVRRALRSETPIRVLRHANVPVLAVAATARDLPRTAVVGVDFSPASLRAAREARDLLDRPGTLYLVHVGPALAGANCAQRGGWPAVYEAGVSLMLDKLAKELSDAGLTVIPRTETGSIAEGVLKAAHEVGAELIACGTHGFNAIERLLLGSVPTRILRGAGCSVLIAPTARAEVERW